jgi:hypothetical protein
MILVPENKNTESRGGRKIKDRVAGAPELICLQSGLKTPTLSKLQLQV